jgi:hypothetical protein
VVDGRLEHVGVRVGALGDEITPAPGAGIDDRPPVRRRLREWREAREREVGHAFRPFLRPEIERVRLEGPVRGRGGIRGADRRGPRVEIVLHLGEPLAGRILDQCVEDHRHVRDVVEQSVHAVMEERQPVLHAWIAAALAHRLVEPVVASRRPKAAT